MPWRGLLLHAHAAYERMLLCLRLVRAAYALSASAAAVGAQQSEKS